MSEPVVWASRETVLGAQRVTEDGTLRRPREPVALIVNPVVGDTTVFCDWLFTHPGLVPGAYEFETGVTLVIPDAACSPDGSALHATTLEVTHEQQEEDQDRSDRPEPAR